MTHPEPTAVYRSRSFPAADSLVAFLRDSGINAYLVSPLNEYSQSKAGEGPIFGSVYDVYVADYTPDDVQTLLNDWRQQQAFVSTSTDLFCYHCGEVLSTSLATCPQCGKALELSDTGSNPGGE